MSPTELALDEASARRVLLVQALESAAREAPFDGAAAPAWTAADREWATRLARQTTPAGAAPAAFLAERARHVLERMRDRDGALVGLAERRPWRPAWLAAAAGLGLVGGLLVDAIGSSHRINLLAPPVWGVVIWNLCVYLALLVPWRAPAGLRAALQGWLGGSTQAAAGVPGRFRALWLPVSAPLTGARAALLLHTAALAFALGLSGSLYLRGLVLDYRAGWQSTFLDAEQVHTVLQTLLAPASAATGIAVPDQQAVQALRLGPQAVPTASAAPWIHLYVATLALAVMLPRALLALWAAVRAGRLAWRLPLPAGGLYVQRLLHQQGSAPPLVQVLPHGAAPDAAALAGLRIVLAAALGDGVQLSVAPASTHGDEDGPAAAPPQGTTLRLALAELGATPEDDSHGRWLKALRRAAPALPPVLLVDESAFVARLGTLPARVAERRTLWQRWAAAQALPLCVVRLTQPDPHESAAALHEALLA